jgi:hypothetical protein
VLERERVELPLVIGALLHEVQDAGRRLGLDPTPASRADSELAGFRLQKNATGDGVLSDERERPALIEPRENAAVRFDLRERIEPKLAFRLAALEAQNLLRLIERDGEFGEG